MSTITFPTVSGRNLNRRQVTFPQDFTAPYNLILLAFYQRQQLDINTWIPFAQKIENARQDFEYIEFPVVYKMGPIRQFMLNEGMRAGIPDKTARQRTVTLYLEKSRFLDHLKIDSQNDIQILLLSNKGVVLWRETGILTSTKQNALRDYLMYNNELEKATTNA